MLPQMVAIPVPKEARATDLVCRTYLEKSLNQIGSDDKPATVRIRKLADDAKMRKVWSKVKDKMIYNDELDKDDKKVLKKLYESFDGGLSDAITKFEKSDTDEEAIRHAQAAIEITKDYGKKVKAMSEELPGTTAMALGGLLVELRGFLEEWVEKLS